MAERALVLELGRVAVAQRPEREAFALQPQPQQHQLRRAVRLRDHHTRPQPQESMTAAMSSSPISMTSVDRPPRRHHRASRAMNDGCDPCVSPPLCAMRLAITLRTVPCQACARPSSRRARCRPSPRSAPPPPPCHLMASSQLIASSHDDGAAAVMSGMTDSQALPTAVSAQQLTHETDLAS
eukprot:COSAG01_NODE_4893_length_4645_cov_132.805983_2_plen_182_part_00